MAQKRRIRNCILICTYLLALPSGRAALTCCRRDRSDGSTSCHLSADPEPDCSTEWIADGVTVVDQSGDTDQTRVQRVDPQTLVLKQKHSAVTVQMDCELPKNLVKLPCDDLCPSEEVSTATEPQSTVNAGNKNASDGVFILLSVIIIFIFTVS